MLEVPNPRPPLWQEKAGSRLFRALAPHPGNDTVPATPPQLEPAEELDLPRRQGGVLSATFYPAPTTQPRGAVLLLHPWLSWGRAYFHRRGRIVALREAGYHVLTPDLPGFGRSEPPRLFFDRDLEDALRYLRERAEGLPIHLWGVSSGGYWSHPMLAREKDLRAAVFEDVSPHLLEWSWRMSPWGRPFYWIFRAFLGSAYAYLDIRRHAAACRGKAILYVGGDADPGIPVRSFEEMRDAAEAELLLVPGAGHLQSIKQAQEEILRRALELFRRAEDPNRHPDRP